MQSLFFLEICLPRTTSSVCEIPFLWYTEYKEGLTLDGGVCMVRKMRVLSGLPIASSGELLKIIDGLLWALPPPASLCPSLRGKPPASMGSALVQAVLEETVGANDLQLRFCDSLNTSRHTQATARGGRTR